MSGGGAAAYADPELDAIFLDISRMCLVASSIRG